MADKNSGLPAFSNLAFDALGFDASRQRTLQLDGWNAGSHGIPEIANLRKTVAPTGFSALEFGWHRTWNLRQLIFPVDFSVTYFGTAYVQGGVKFVEPNGVQGYLSGTHSVTNTRASQFAAPAGITPPELGQLLVSPRFLRAVGILGTGVGQHTVQFPPSPSGWLSSAMGYPVVDFKTKKVLPAGINAYDTGYSRVRDRAQKVLALSVSVSDVFGDVAARLRTFKIQVPGLYAHEPNPWAVLRNSRRYVVVYGGDGLAFGPGNIRNKSPSVAPVSIDSLHFGDADISGWIKRIAPKGVPGLFDALPSPVLSQTPSLGPHSVSALDVPAPTVWLRRRSFDIGGFSTLLMGAVVVDYRWRKLVLQDAGIAAAAYGTARVEHSYRALTPESWTQEWFGQSWLSYRRRVVEPLGIEHVDMSRHQIGGSRYLGPVGFEATRWLTRIVPEATEIFPKSFGAAYGWPAVEHFRRYLQPIGFATDTDYRDRWGLARAWNLRQYVIQEESAESLLWPPKFSQWLKVDSRNKTIRAIGYVATLSGRSQLDNKARLLAPHGITHPFLPEYQKTGSVTHHLRPLALSGIEPPSMSRWAVVWNKAVPLRPAGLMASLFGQASLVNTRRYRTIQGFDALAKGFPFVAYGVREIAFESRYSIAPVRVPLPDVRLNTRHVDAPGFDGSVRGQSKLGLPIVVSHFNRVIPRWVHQDRFGYPAARNLTPTIYPRNWLDGDFGSQQVRLQWRPVAPVGTNTQVFGQPRIADRLQKLQVPGLATTGFGSKLTVRRVGLDPVAPQFIDLRVMYADDSGIQHEAAMGYGIEPPINQVSRPNLLKGYVYPISSSDAGDMLKLGKPVITANTIRVEPGYWDLLFGEPAVTLKNRTLRLIGMGPLVVDALDSEHMGSWGMARLSPHTIYAVVEATDQAKRNHGKPLAPIAPLNDGAKFGQPSLSKYLNAITQYNSYLGGDGPPTMGAPSVYNQEQRIRALGWSSMRIGLVTIPGPQAIEHDDSVEIGEFGMASVSYPPYIGPSNVLPSAWSAMVMGGLEVSHFHRTISAKGQLMELMGSSLGNSGENMPNTLYVGPPNLHEQTGFDVSRSGVPWVSHRVRELAGNGWDSFTCEYDYQNFEKRMRVRRTGQSSAQWQVLKPSGFMATQVSASDVRPGVRYIRPDGNSDQYRKGVST